MATIARVRAAGGVICRPTADGDTEVVLIHRADRNDWTFPKGKLEAGESEEACALREVEEETGLRCVLDEELASTAHLDRKGRLKLVRYWRMRAIGGRIRAGGEVDAVRWLPLAEAVRMLSYERDRALLDAFAAAPR